jgi:putative endonuclease
LKDGRKSHRLGRQAEQQALHFLTGSGLKFLGKNFRAAHGEIDLILQDGDTIVFVEVRARTNPGYMDAVESIDSRKVNSIIQASRLYLHKHGISDSALCRFDVVTLTGKLRTPKIEWIKNAFEA